jgi:hypothetical protein
MRCSFVYQDQQISLSMGHGSRGYADKELETTTPLNAAYRVLLFGACNTMFVLSRAWMQDLNPIIDIRTSSTPPRVGWRPRSCNMGIANVCMTITSQGIPANS